MSAGFSPSVQDGVGNVLSSATFNSSTSLTATATSQQQSIAVAIIPATAPQNLQVFATTTPSSWASGPIPGSIQAQAAATSNPIMAFFTPESGMTPVPSTPSLSMPPTALSTSQFLSQSLDLGRVVESSTVDTSSPFIIPSTSTSTDFTLPTSTPFSTPTTSSSSQSISTTSETSVPTTTPNVSTPTPNTPPVGVLVVAIVLPILFVLLVILLFTLWSWRRARQRRADEEHLQAIQQYSDFSRGSRIVPNLAAFVMSRSTSRARYAGLDGSARDPRSSSREGFAAVPMAEENEHDQSRDSLALARTESSARSSAERDDFRDDHFDPSNREYDAAMLPEIRAHSDIVWNVSEHERPTTSECADYDRSEADEALDHVSDPPPSSISSSGPSRQVSTRNRVPSVRRGPSFLRRTAPSEISSLHDSEVRGSSGSQIQEEDVSNPVSPISIRSNLRFP